MKKEELRKKLEQEGISGELYNLDETGRHDERFCLEKEGNDWNVYFMERGIKTMNERFGSEDEACQFIYEQLLD